MKRSKSFTMVELIIVILILGILAAIAIPQFISATSDAKTATLQANLAVVRNSINLYYHQHNATMPGAKKVDGLGLDTVVADNPVAFTTQLTIFTDDTGKTNTSLDRALYPYGPYLVNGIPTNVKNDLATVLVVTDADALTAADITGATGWIYSKVTGEFRANSTGDLAN